MIFTYIEEPATGPEGRDVDKKTLEREKGCE